jgi:ankyrin repeat protein
MGADSGHVWKEIRMSDAIPLPPRADLEQYKKLAKDLLRASLSAFAKTPLAAPRDASGGDAVPDAVRAHDAVQSWALRWMESLARSRGEVAVQMARDADAITRRWLALLKKNGATQSSLAEAQFFLAREHGFPSWPKFAEQVRALQNAQSPVAHFEVAADAIVAGDERALAALLGKDPILVKARSLRQHRSTLLHYCSANGVEDFRQKTPRNIVPMARMLLDAGAEVNAESDVYGGGSTALMLTATSVHPKCAGVQIALLELLLERGAAIDIAKDRSTVVACLHNGHGAAAEFLRARGARLDLEGAAGVGALDRVMEFFAADGGLRASATAQQLADGFGWACEFGHAGVVAFLLEHGARADRTLGADRVTPLHWAALGGNAEIAQLLLARNADVDAREARFGGTPLGWALHAWSQRAADDDGKRYCEVAAALVQAGASVAGLESVTDLRMLAALDLPSRQMGLRREW